MKKILFLIFLIPFLSLSQKENQFLTSQKGIFIEQNNQGKFGIVNEKGKVLVPMVNDYVKELSQGGGFIVYEKIIIEGPDYNSGVLRFYNENIKDVFNRTFSRISNAGQDLLICYQDSLCGVFNKNGKTLAPICFSEIKSLNGQLFWFEAEHYLRSEIENILSSQTISDDTHPENIKNRGEDGYNLFQGVFNADGKLICKGQFRIVEILTYKGNNSLFAVQNQIQFIENNGAAYFAIMNGKGELVSDYIYSEVIKFDGKLIGEIEMEDELKKVLLDDQGKPKNR